MRSNRIIKPALLMLCLGLGPLVTPRLVLAAPPGFQVRPAKRAHRPQLRALRAPFARLRSQAGRAGAFLRQRLKTRTRRAQELLKRRLPFRQKVGVYRAHLVGLLERGANGKLAKPGNYTFGQQRRKLRILQRAGFGKAERKSLMRAGITGGSLEGALVGGALWAGAGVLATPAIPYVVGSSGLSLAGDMALNATVMGLMGAFIGATMD